MGTYSKVVAIDGPSGSGKSTIARAVAKQLNLKYLDTGAMFRTMALYLADSNLLPLDFRYEAPDKIFIDGVNYAARIREHHVSELASKISTRDDVRNFLKEIQQQIGRKETCVLEGRDIGTVVFPNAFLKIFLTADVEQRAERRFKELDKRIPLEQIIQDIKARDLADRTRAIAPLKKAHDAIELNSSSLSIEQVTEKVIELYRKHSERIKD